MGSRDARRHVREEGLDLCRHAERRIGRAHLRLVLGSRLLRHLKPSAPFRRQSFIASGMASEKNCAPWLPPKTSSWNGSSPRDGV